MDKVSLYSFFSFRSFEGSIDYLMFIISIIININVSWVFMFIMITDEYSCLLWLPRNIYVYYDYPLLVRLLRLLTILLACLNSGLIGLVGLNGVDFSQRGERTFIVKKASFDNRFVFIFHRFDYGWSPQRHDSTACGSVRLVSSRR